MSFISSSSLSASELSLPRSSAAFGAENVDSPGRVVLELAPAAMEWPGLGRVLSMTWLLGEGSLVLTDAEGWLVPGCVPGTDDWLVLSCR